MNHEYDLVEKFELHTTPPEDGNRLIKTWRSFVLIKGNDASPQYSFGELCEEIVLDTKANLRIGGERITEECDSHDKNLSKLLRLLATSKRDLPTQAYILFEKAQSQKTCALLNGPTMLRAQQDLQDLLRLPQEIANNSTNTSLRLYLKNVLHLFAQWFKEADLPLPPEIEEILFHQSARESRHETDRKRFAAICEAMNLEKEVTLNADTLYEIGMQMFPERMPKRKDFVSHEKMYDILRDCASDTGYANKRES